MTHVELDWIEQGLAIRLPESYRRRVAPFPVVKEEGNCTSQVWDDARELFALNERVRAEIDGWPQWLFVIGQSEGDPCGFAIDTRSPDCPVWWLEQMELGRYSGPSEGPFATWFDQWVADS